MITKAPILTYYKQDVKTIVETNSSNYVRSGALSQSSEVYSQLDDDGLLYFVAFYLKNFNPTKCNYEIYDKLLLAIIKCFEYLKPMLEGTGVLIKVIIDHKSPKYFMTTKKLIKR